MDLDFEKTKEAINSSLSLSEVARKLDIKESGTFRRHIKKFVLNNDVPTEHFTGQLWNKGKVFIREELFCENSLYPTRYVRKIVIQEHLIDYKCAKCGTLKWNDEPLILELHHINGNRSDHRIENLQFLCPNCHSQTSSFRGKGIQSGKIKVSDEEILEHIKKSSNVSEVLSSAGLGGAQNYNRMAKILFKIVKSNLEV